MTTELEIFYDLLVESPATNSFVVTWLGKHLRCKWWAKYPSHRNSYNIIPGSFNPLHAGHEFMYEKTKSSVAGYLGSFYEISIARMGKEDLSFEELQERLDQFEADPPNGIIVTNAPRMIEKIGVLGGGHNFYVGIDTIKRMALDYTMHGIAGLNAKFFVMDREIDSKVEGWSNSAVPNNVFRANHQPPKELLGISSTKIREGWKEKQKAASKAAVENVSELIKAYESSKCITCKLTRGELRKRGNHVWNYNGMVDWECDFCTKTIEAKSDQPLIDPTTCLHESVITHSNGHKDCLNCKKRLTWT